VLVEDVVVENDVAVRWRGGQSLITPPAFYE